MPGPSARYLHTASFLRSGLMLVFGGNTHNDTVHSYGAKCYSGDMLAYDVNCNSWQVILCAVIYNFTVGVGSTGNILCISVMGLKFTKLIVDRDLKALSRWLKKKHPAPAAPGVVLFRRAFEGTMSNSRLVE